MVYRLMTSHGTGVHGGDLRKIRLKGWLAWQMGQFVSKSGNIALYRAWISNYISKDTKECDFLSRYLTHWGWVTYICFSKLTIIGSDNGLAPRRRQTIIWTDDGILLIGPLGTNFSEILIGMQTFSFKCTWKCSLRNGLHFVSASMCWYQSCPHSLWLGMITSKHTQLIWERLENQAGNYWCVFKGNFQHHCKKWQWFPGQPQQIRGVGAFHYKDADLPVAVT